MSADWAPTGREFVSGSYDRTVRLWTAGEGKARDTYHTKRMQRVFTSLYTLDSRYVLSGSDDSNLRIWKANAADKLGVVDKREMARKEYRDGLREKWGTVADVAKLERCVRIPGDHVWSLTDISHTFAGSASFRSRSTMPSSSAERCSTLGRRKRRTAAPTRPRDSPSRARSSQSRRARLRFSRWRVERTSLGTAT